jgi:hypothetical protein
MKLYEFFQINFSSLSEALDQEDAIRKIKKLQNTAGRNEFEIENIKRIINKLSQEFNIPLNQQNDQSSIDPLKAKIAKATYNKMAAADAFKSEWNNIKRHWFAEDTINELTDRPYPYTLSTSNAYGEYKYYFTNSKNKSYVVEISGDERGIYVLFGIIKSRVTVVNITGTGDAYRVFSTVIEIIKNHTNQHNPKLIIFSSDTDEPSRTRLYQKFVKRLDQVLPNYALEDVDDSSGSVSFTLKRKEKSISESIEPKEFRQILKIFLPFAQKIIKLDKLPTIILRKTLDDDHQPTHGRFHSDKYVLEIAISNRQPVDILRTLAHELVHAKQERDGVNIDPTTGSPDENEANALAGVVMRHFNKQYPEFLSFQPIAESTKNGRTRIC